MPSSQKFLVELQFLQFDFFSDSPYGDVDGVIGRVIRVDFGAISVEEATPAKTLSLLSLPLLVFGQNVMQGGSEFVLDRTDIAIF